MVRYGEIEAALARVFEVPREELGAFRGRLRHLRNLGVPDLAKPGSGQRVEYTRQNAIEIMLALELAALGVSPRHAAEAAKSQAERVAALNMAVTQRGDCLVVTHLRQFSNDPGTTAIVLQRFTQEMMEFLMQSQNRFAVINVRRMVGVLDVALCRTAA